MNKYKIQYEVLVTGEVKTAPHIYESIDMASYTASQLGRESGGLILYWVVPA